MHNIYIFSLSLSFLSSSMSWCLLPYKFLCSSQLHSLPDHRPWPRVRPGSTPCVFPPPEPSLCQSAWLKPRPKPHPPPGTSSLRLQHSVSLVPYTLQPLIKTGIKILSQKLSSGSIGAIIDQFGHFEKYLKNLVTADKTVKHPSLKHLILT